MTELKNSDEINLLLGDSSRKGIDMAVQVVGDNPEIFKQFLDIAMRDKGQITMRASRVINFATLKHPQLFEPYASDIAKKLPHIKHHSLKRELIKTFAENDFGLDDETTSDLLELCFRWFTDQNEKIAVQAYALDVLYNISNDFPDLKFELLSVIEQQQEFMSTGMKVRIRKMLPKLIKETSKL